MSVNLAPPDSHVAISPDTQGHFPAHSARNGVRVIGLRDRGYAARFAVVQRWLPDASEHTFDDNDTQVLSQASYSLDMLVLHGKDIDRMGRILKGWRSVLPSKVLVAVVATSDAHERSALLHSGADTVLEIEMADRLVSSWLGALLSRAAQNAQAADAAAPLVPLPSEFGITAREQSLLDVLLRRTNDTVPYANLLSALGKPLGKESHGTLRVAICKLRKKVSSSIRIYNCTGAGYGASVLQTRAGTDLRPSGSPN